MTLIVQPQPSSAKTPAPNGARLAIVSLVAGILAPVCVVLSLVAVVGTFNFDTRGSWGPIANVAFVGSILAHITAVITGIIAFMRTRRQTDRGWPIMALVGVGLPIAFWGCVILFVISVNMGTSLNWGRWR